MAMPMIFLLIESLIIEQSTLGQASVARMGYLFNLPIDPMFDDARDKLHLVAIARTLKPVPRRILSTFRMSAWCVADYFSCWQSVCFNGGKAEPFHLGRYVRRWDPKRTHQQGSGQLSL